MPKRRVSGREVIKVLIKKFGFKFIKQKGSHVKLSKIGESGKITTVVPDHKELDFGTLRGVLRLAKVDERKFWEKI